VVHPDGSGEAITFPADSVTANRDVSTLTGELAADGEFHGRLEHVATGNQQYALRRMFATALGPAERDRVTRAVAGTVFPGAGGDSLELFDGRDLRAEPRIALVVRGARLTSPSGAEDILTLPLHNYGEVKGLAAELAARGPRRFPINVAAVAGPHAETAELTITLPPGWRASLPPNVSATSVFGTYTAQYAQNGRVLHVMRRLVGRTGTEPPERIGQLIAWLNAVGADDVRYVVLHHA
jgi:hypothetical protein